MYKFTNGFITYDEKTKNNLLKSGYKLAEEKPVEEKPVEKETNGNEDDNTGVIEEEHPRSNKKPSRSRE